MSFDLQAALQQAATEGPNHNEASGGGDFERVLPAEGLVRLRLVGYIELGKHAGEYQGKPNMKDKVAMIFELSGPKHPPLEVGEGKKIPQTITITMAKSLNEKGTFYKLFKRLNHTGVHKIFAQMLAVTPLIGTIHHVVDKTDPNKKYANLSNEEGYTIRPAFIDSFNEETGEVTQRALPVDEPLSPLKCFLWDYPSKEMWDAIYIDGTWEDKKDKEGKVIKEGTSKNYWQNRIMSATNWKGSPMAEILFAGGEPDLGGAEAPERSEADKQAGVEKDAGAAPDPLAGV